MLRTVLLTTTLLVSVTAFGMDRAELRDLYFKAAEDKAAATSIVDALTKPLTSDAEELGYLGATYAVMAKHVGNPYTKWEFFQGGKKFLEKAIALAPASTELRFLRLSIQLNAPKFLGYSDNIEADKKLVWQYLEKDGTAQDPFWEKAASILLASGAFNEEEQLILEKTVFLKHQG